jgi:hypothetical protein
MDGTGNIVLSEVARFRRQKTTCFSSFVDYRPTTNTAIL